MIHRCPIDGWCLKTPDDQCWICGIPLEVLHVELRFTLKGAVFDTLIREKVEIPDGFDLESVTINRATAFRDMTEASIRYLKKEVKE